MTDMFPRCPKCGSKNVKYPLGLAPTKDEAYLECEDCGYKWDAPEFDGSKRRRTNVEKRMVKLLLETLPAFDEKIENLKKEKEVVKKKIEEMRRDLEFFKKKGIVNGVRENDGKNLA